MMSNVKTYTLTSAVSGETATPAGLVKFDFKAGDVTPSTPDEARILADLEANGLATEKTAAPAKPAKPAKVEE
jgi:hypothetical protein